MRGPDRWWFVAYRAIQMVAAFDIGAGVAVGDWWAVVAVAVALLLLNPLKL